MRCYSTACMVLRLGNSWFWLWRAIDKRQDGTRHNVSSREAIARAHTCGVIIDLYADRLIREGGACCAPQRRKCEAK